MSELPVTSLDDVREAKRSTRDELFERHFGSLSVTAARLNVEAYCDQGMDRDIAVAWIMNDRQRVKDLVASDDKNERARVIRLALTNITSQLVTHPQTQKYRGLLPYGNVY